jgi:hypothetical protein
VPKIAELSKEESSFLKDREKLAEKVSPAEDHFLNW